MDFNIDQLKKKIIYRSNYRGTKEMDKLLSAFTKKYIDQLNNDELIDLEKLLDIDDSHLYNFFNGIETKIKFDETKVFKLFKNFEYNKDY